MDFKYIIDCPTSVMEIPKGASGVHESCLKSYHVLNYAKSLLKRGCPSDIVLEIIEALENQTETTGALK